MEYFDHGSIRDVDFLVGCFLMVRREAMDLVGLMDERFFIYYEEVDWCKRFWEAGWRVTFFPNGESIHNNAGSSSSNPVRFSIEQQKALLKYWHKYNSILSMFGLYSILTTGYLIRLCSHGLASMCSTKYAETHKTEIYNNKACLSGLLKHISN
jgi:GT2 family glycosyltransferase